MFENNTSDGRAFLNALEVSKNIHIDVINEVKRVCSGGVLLFVLFFEKLSLLKKTILLIKNQFDVVMRFLL